MMPIGEIHRLDIGTKFLITIRDEDNDIVDLSSASTLEIRFKKPGGTRVEFDATLETDGTDGQIYYITVEDDLDEQGTWSMQAYIVIPSGTFYSDVTTFKVHTNLEE